MPDRCFACASLFLKFKVQLRVLQKKLTRRFVPLQVALPPKKKPKRKGGSACHARKRLGPLEFVSKAREDASKRYKSKKAATLDIEQNVREIRAILSTNAEIFERCNDYCEEIDTDEHVVYFRRTSFNTVFVDGMIFYSTPEHQTKSFSLVSLMELPSSINNVIVSKKMSGTFANYIDYESFFENVLALNDNVLEPFLAKLKEHLMDVQVSLGEVDTWIMQPADNKKYLEETFHVDLNDLSVDTSLRHHVTLKTVTDSSFGTHEAAFDLNTTKGRNKLNKFLAFVGDD